MHAHVLQTFKQRVVLRIGVVCTGVCRSPVLSRQSEEVKQIQRQKCVECSLNNKIILTHSKWNSGSLLTTVPITGQDGYRVTQSSIFVWLDNHTKNGRLTKCPIVWQSFNGTLLWRDSGITNYIFKDYQLQIIYLKTFWLSLYWRATTAS